MDNRDYNIRKGVRVRACWYDANFNASLAGVQMKASATRREVVGVVTHVYGDHPTRPTEVWLSIQPDDGGPEVENVPCNARTIEILVE
jgi:hypothetical protein